MQNAAAIFHRLHGKARPFVGTFAYGLVASLAAVAFQLAINWLYNICFDASASHSNGRFYAISFAAIVVSSLIVGALLRLAPSAAGSGIPQVKLSFWKEFGHSQRRIALIKFFAGVLSIGGGQSLGREGPTVQIGSNLASSLAGILGVTKQNRRAASAAGAAAGLAAAFNAPLAAVAFVVVEVICDLNSQSLGPVLLASVVGAFVVHACIGAQPAFALPQITEPTWRSYSLMPLVAALAAVIGVLFQRSAIALRGWARRLPVQWLHPLLGGLVTWGIGCVVFAMSGRLGVFALGYDDISDALRSGTVWNLAIMLLIGKLLATIAGYGFGGCGGIFSPNLFFGAMCGAAVAGLAKNFLDVGQADSQLLIVGGMSACLGSVVQAPVTAILIIFEMTHQFALVPGLMLAGLISQAIARSINHLNFYDEILRQDGHQIEHVVPPRDLRSWQNLPVSAIANFNPVVISDVTEQELGTLIRDYSYQCFPVLRNGHVEAVVTRAEIVESLKEHRLPREASAVTCQPNETIRALQTRFIESKSGMLILTNGAGGKMLGLVTLHDLLRAQLAMGEREAR